MPDSAPWTLSPPFFVRFLSEIRKVPRVYYLLLLWIGFFESAVLFEVAVLGFRGWEFFSRLFCALDVYTLTWAGHSLGTGSWLVISFPSVLVPLPCRPPASVKPGDSNDLGLRDPRTHALFPLLRARLAVVPPRAGRFFP